MLQREQQELIIITKCGEMLRELRDWWLLKEKPVSWN
jgi:hypothetical protein